MLHTGEMRVIVRDSTLNKRATCEALRAQGDDGARERIRFGMVICSGDVPRRTRGFPACYFDWLRPDS
jgi:hypothetical protein